MSDQVTLTIDGVQVTVPKGTLIVEAAKQIENEIPVFCYEPRIGPAVGNRPGTAGCDRPIQPDTRYRNDPEPGRQGRAQRPLPLRQRQEIQGLLHAKASLMASAD